MSKPDTNRVACFQPQRLDTLLDCMKPLIGKSFLWDFVGTGHDDEPYPGQRRWLIARKHDDELPEEARGRWVPDEDLARADADAG